MTHFGILCPATTGHLNTFIPLGQELQRRGHRVTLCGIADAQSQTRAAGLDFRLIGKSEFPEGTVAQSYALAAKLRGLKALQHIIRLRQRSAAMILRDAPAALKEAGVDALLVDQVTSAGGSVADFLSIPFISVCSALPINQEDGVPPFFTSWNYSPCAWARLRNQGGYFFFERIRQLLQKVINEYRHEWKLPLYSHPNDSFSKLAQIAQQPAEFEFPREQLPQYFHFTGPYHDLASRKAVDFPFEKLTGQPLIYASMGTLQNRFSEIFQCMASACAGLDAQLVISLGGLRPEAMPKLLGNPIVVEYAPQLELLKRATLTITHAGLNTTLESLCNGVPMVAIPMTDDQPGVAARLAWTGAGEVVHRTRLNPSRLRTAIEQVLTKDSYKKSASSLQNAIARSGGVSRAADIVEIAVSTGKPILTNSF